MKKEFTFNGNDQIEMAVTHAASTLNNIFNNKQ